VENVLYSFTDGADGADPYSTLIADKEGNLLYGTTGRGGTGRVGTVFKLSLSNGVWAEKVLHSFKGRSDGDQPYEGVSMNTNGYLYGTTAYGGGTGCGGAGCGTVFRLKK
jgi:uncharacterized repeat protein (TIGR03803 family)